MQKQSLERSNADTTTPSVKPTNYDISLFDLQPHAPWSYQGRIKIDLTVKRATKTITLNTHELEVHSAEVSVEAGKTAASIKASKISYDAKNQRCTLSFDQEIPEAQVSATKIGPGRPRQA